MPSDETQKTPIQMPVHNPPGPHVDETMGHGINSLQTRTATVLPALTIGPYRVIRTIGQGGMGVVYLVRDDRTNRDVALKVIPAGPDAEPTDLARFKIEAQAVRKLEHPNIVRLYDFGETENEAYLAMEYVEGGTLHRRISRGGPLDPMLAARLVEQLARACHYAHTSGVLHRDLKPSNILLHDEAPASEADPIPMLADFGLAKQLDRLTRVTQTGTAVGTPHYMAPEQARGEKNIGPALDIHGLGAILYESLTGRPPFDGGSAAATMEQVVHQTPVPPDRLRTAVPAGLSAICMRCLEKSPSRRYPSAEALANDLRHFQVDPTDITSYVVLPVKRKSQLPLYAIAGSILLLLGLSSYGTYFLVSRGHRAQLESERQKVEELSQAEQRTRLESAIGLCERGQVREGIVQMRELPKNSALPVKEVIEAWEGRLLEQVASAPITGSEVTAMSTNGARYALARHGRVSIWKTADWSKEERIWTIEGNATALGWSEDGNQIAIGTSSGKVLLGDVAKDRVDPKPLVERPNREVAAVRFSFPGVRIVYAGQSLEQEYVPPLRAIKAGEIDPFQLASGTFISVAVAATSANAAVLTEAGSVRVFDAGDGRWRDLPPDGDVSAVGYSPDGNVLAIGTRNGTIRLWDAIARSPLSDSFEVGGRVLSVAMGIQGSRYTVVVCAEDRPVIVLQCGRPFVAPPIRLADRVGNEVMGVSFSGDGSRLYLTSPYGLSLWRIWDAKRFSQERDMPADERFQQPAGPGARFSAPSARGPDGSFLLSGSGGKVFLIDDNGQTMHRSIGKSDKHDATSLAVAPGGQMTSATNVEGRSLLRHWCNDTNSPCEHELHSRVNQEAFLPDGSGVLLACADGHVRLWDPAANEIRADLDCGAAVLAIAADEKGRHVLAGCVDGSAKLWDLQENRLLKIVRHSAEVRGVAFQNGNLVTASADGSARRWHAGTGLPLGPAMRHPDSISALDTYGDLIATGGRGRYVRVWRLP